ncbi:MAG: SDR family NAD(P)-dependent oxidoreductase [Parvibaculales bacterium]
MKNLTDGFTAIVIGASGGIGGALAHRLQAMPGCKRLIATARTPEKGQDLQSLVRLDTADETMIAAFAATLDTEVDLVINATGLLHDPSRDIFPERSLRHLDMDQMQAVFAANAFGPALLIKHLLPKLPRQRPAVFASLSARVGSISDNRLGGWYAYRAAKAAHNMLVKTAALEAAHRYKQAVVVGLHPGTVETGLSEPFKGNVPAEKLFTPDQSAGYLLQVLSGLSASDSGKVFDWKGQEVPA